MRYFYARVSSKDQSLERQVQAAKDYGKTIDGMFYDKQSGKDFNRPEYQRMKSKVQKGDEVIIKELDRLGRDQDGIKREIEWYKQQGVTLRILDMPTTLIDFNGQDWVGEMVNNILIEVLGAIAEQERKKIKTRQAEGIAAMPVIDGKRIGKRGRAYGRPRAEIDSILLAECKSKQNKGEMTILECCERLNISKSKWYQL